MKNRDFGVKSKILAALAPVLKLFLRRKGYMVIGSLTEDGVGQDTLDRCAAIASAKASGPISESLRRHCGDIAAPPDRFIEVEGLGVSAQFAGQMIHMGSAEYLNGLEVETPDLPGEVVFVSLEGRLLGGYRVLDMM
jgi:cation transport ATPase